MSILTEAHALIYWLIAMAPITFSKTNCAATSYMRAATKPLWKTRAAVTIWYLHDKKFRYHISPYVYQLVRTYSCIVTTTFCSTIWVHYIHMIMYPK